jgi:cytochrome c-type biogenesis protein CcmE
MLLGGGALIAATVALVLNAFRSNLVFFVTPTQVAAGEVQGRDALRIGGLVQLDSVRRDAGSLRVSFVLTDNAHQVPVVYDGVLPDLFSAGKGAIAQGRLDASGRLVATEVLAKHDENYMPPEAAQALNQAHVRGVQRQAEEEAAKAAQPKASY